MLDVFKTYYRTVHNFLKYQNQKAFELFIEENLYEIFDNHDNWNGGIDYFTIELKVSVEQYLQIKGDDENIIIEDITDAFNNALKSNESLVINKIIIVPYDDATVYTPTTESIWGLDYFRLFISHISENKVSAKNLKVCLEKWGIHGFVAHEDIEPSKEWSSILTDALFSMNALCAILVKRFRYSSWCDQEVGIALGQNKLCIPIKKDIIPYGFLGRYQMIKADGLDASHVAQKVAECVFKDERTHGIYCNSLAKLLINSKTSEKALQWIDVINSFPTIERVYAELIYKEYSHNPILLQPDVLQGINSLLKRYNMSTSLFIFGDHETSAEDLPF